MFGDEAAIVIKVYSVGLRQIECLDFKVEKIVGSKEGYTITHTQAKQSADMVSTKYLVPEKGGYAKQLASTLTR
jgi:L-2-hydroxyglutarate oxidase LhgO